MRTYKLTTPAIATYSLANNNNNVNFSVFVENGMDYRNGGMTGAWFDLPMTEEELVEAFAKIGVKYSDDDCVLNRDYVITDFDNNVEYEVGDYEPIGLLNDLAERLNNVDDLVWLQAYMDETSESLDEAIDHYEDNSVWYDGMTLEEVAEELVDDTENLSDFAKRYFDYEAFANDLRIDGYVEYDGGVLYVY